MNRSRSRMAAAVGLAVAASLTGCLSAADCDPNKTGAVTTLACAGGGGYGERTRVLKDEAEAERSKGDTLRKEVGAAQSEIDVGKERQRTLDTQVRLVERKLDNIDLDLSALEEKLKPGLKNKAVLKQQIDDLERQLKAVEANAASRSPATRERSNQTRKKLIDIQKRLDSL